jgi:pyridoxine 4-dehydrogenase
LRSPRPITSVSPTPTRTIVNVANRSEEALLDACEREGIAFMPFFPRASEAFAGDGALTGIARSRGATPAQVALAWLLHRWPVAPPIPGHLVPWPTSRRTWRGRLRLEDGELAAHDAAPAEAGR